MGNIVNRVFDSSGPEGKVRGTPQQIIEKYNQLARDAQLSNDRVAAENFQQHAEHYTRLLGEAMREQEARREQHEAQQSRDQRPQRESYADGLDDQDDVSTLIEADADSGEADSGLVETPEEKPAPRKRARKPKPAPVAESGDNAETAADETPQAPAAE
ncbi:DUF4167 domain-containing protein [Actibacterium sp.]|uniref:DUF4167 domain-containing protein n=1 Tax=Actibacterium sp. TaxID=1872125 RepID=UPI003563DAC3